MVALEHDVDPTAHSAGTKETPEALLPYRGRPAPLNVADRILVSEFPAKPHARNPGAMRIRIAAEEASTLLQIYAGRHRRPCPTIIKGEYRRQNPKDGSVRPGSPRKKPRQQSKAGAGFPSENKRECRKAVQREGQAFGHDVGQKLGFGREPRTRHKGGEEKNRAA